LKPQKRINRPRFCYESGWIQSSSASGAYPSSTDGAYYDRQCI